MPAEGRNIPVSEDAVLLARLLDGTAEGLFLTRSDSVLVYANHRAAAILGREPEAVPGLRLSEAIPPEVCPEIAGRFGQAALERQEVRFGSYCAQAGKWLNVRIVPVDAFFAFYIEDDSDRRNAEETLRRRDEELQSLTDNLPAIVSSLDRDLRMMQLNRTYEQVFGRSVEWAIGRHLSEVAGEPHFSIAKPWLDRALAGERVQFESCLRRRDGQLRDISVTYTPQIRNGEVHCITAMVQDITDRKRVVQALEESEHRLRLAAAIARIGSFEYDALAGEVSGTPQWERNAGIGNGPAAVSWTELLSRVHPDDRQALENSVSGALRTGGTYECEYRITDDEGSVHWLVEHGIALREELGPARRIAGVTRDVTRRRRVEEVLRHTAERLSLALSAAHMGDWSWDAERDEVTLSAAACEIFGVQKGLPVCGADLLQRLHPDDRESAAREMKRAAEERNDYTLEFRVCRDDGSWRWVLASGRGTSSNGGTRKGVIGVVQDTTSRREAEDALRRSNKELRLANEDLQQFAYSASHDLREPLRMISAFSQLLQRRYKGSLDAQADAYIDFAVRGAERMDALIRDLLAYTRITTAADALKPALVDAGQVLNRVLLNLKVAIEDNQASIRAGDLPQVPIHDVHLELLFQNLIGNALKYRGAETPVIRIEVRLQGSQWQFSVADNGIGIAPQYAAQVFGLFRRLHRPEEYPGTGIGLAICQKIVQRYGGRIWVESDGRGKGSTFHFTIDAAGAMAQEERRASEAGVAGGQG